ncbi:MAG: HAD-IIIC family phosphatase [Candidatus Thorarchaeota archaeon]|nr:HAD-IIIC family phosphatase [Candidatus Thorarchaeota archaeon]
MTTSARTINEILETVRASPTYLNLWSAFKRIQGMALPPPDDPQRTVRIAVIGSSTLEPLAACLDTLLRLEGFHPVTLVGGFNTYRQEALSSNSVLTEHRPDVVILNVDLWSMLDRAFISECVKMSPDMRLELVRKCVDELTVIAKALVQNLSATVLLSNFIVPVFTPFGIADNKLRSGLRELFTEANRALAEAFLNEGRVLVVDLDSIASDFGKSRVVNWNTWYRGTIPYGEDFTVHLAREYTRYFRALKGRSKKCIVLDLDNTLWGGIIGEDGFEGIKLGNTSPGLEYVDFQRALLSLYNRGVILAVDSKNNPEDAMKVIREHPYQVLREEHFAALRINWQSKVQNIVELAEEIGIGLDSMVFIDDNPHERELVRQGCPDVMVVDLPKNPHLYRATIEQLSVFDVLAITKEDLERGSMYAGRRKRTELESQSASLEEFLRTLELKVHIKRADAFTTPRIVQLINKTNQFNVTTRRYTEVEVRSMSSSADSIVYGMSVTDRFGDEGLVGVGILKKRDNRWWIDSFLMSCRVIGRSVETALLVKMVSDAQAQGATEVYGEFIPTKKNAPAKDFFEQHGFELVSADDKGTRVFVLRLTEKKLAVPEWIQLIEE